ncbi:pyridoxamine 5'-phosphate oxidase family protein [Lentzea tibetensis]|uniref:Pyridoxamine 5'-phosphate oxidase family protein n=1 Tax=Lentzea tibetensis TaxID=2591470 RepID=A0A563F0I3_9PSEU|nr:pyridoxamine 5'-phosphate oxidase family protein [Lentzea tibetensis]TWP53487.1 pyridoxamine 5'-phosphate oxidase family protein [Lentzea tibetensis]
MPLTREECLGLLRSVRVGRIIFTQHALPAVRPVPYRVDDGALIVRLPDDVPVYAAHDTVVAFEADDVSQDVACSWTVTVVGHAVEHPDPDQPGRWLLIPVEMVSGRRILEPCTYSE